MMLHDIQVINCLLIVNTTKSDFEPNPYLHKPIVLISVAQCSEHVTLCNAVTFCNIL